MNKLIPAVIATLGLGAMSLSAPSQAGVVVGIGLPGVAVVAPPYVAYGPYGYYGHPYAGFYGPGFRYGYGYRGYGYRGYGYGYHGYHGGYGHGWHR